MSNDELITYRIDISKPAENDLRDILNHISSQFEAPITAFKMLETFEQSMAGLSKLPQRVPKVSDKRLSAMGYRKLIVKNYIIFFSINEKKKIFDIERILYRRRNWQAII